MLSHKQACDAWNAVFNDNKLFRLSALFMGLPPNLRTINANPDLQLDKQKAAEFLRCWANAICPPTDEKCVIKASNGKTSVTAGS